jgi:DNA invertase Pin-like site-specific DNA recombinase
MKPEQHKFVVYCRKSSEDDRQAASIGDQLRELSQLLKREHLRLATDPFTEEKSAKGPGRPVFGKMLQLIERGGANAILCWDIDRLYRNPVDEGRVRWLLQRSLIREIRTPFRTFYPQDAGLLMGVEGGRAADHIITLRKGVFRGFRGKLERGQRPGVAPPGYLNNLASEKGQRNIVPDPERFEFIRLAWNLMLTGQHSVRKIHKLADQRWGLRSRKSKKLGGKPYSLSSWYRIFTDPFYYGFFWWKTPETDTRHLYKGTHVPMITQEEFDRVQLMLGRKGRPLPKSHRFPLSGLIRCGECGAMVTVEAKCHVICSSCRFKFSALNRDACPRCGIMIDDMDNPVWRNYTYYHCTKRKDPTCSQRSLRSDELDRQIDHILTSIQVSEEFKDWAIRAVCDDSKQEAAARNRASESLAERRTHIKRQLEHIKSVILSPDTDWTLISQQEVKDRKLQLLEELTQVERQLTSSRTGPNDTLDLTSRTFEFATYEHRIVRASGIRCTR